MASDVDICNLALARLGDSATVTSIDPPEGSAQAEHCARFYPIARDTLLEAHPWKFAIRRALLAQLDVDTWNWDYAYAEPADALKLLSVLPASAANDTDTEEFEVETTTDGASVVLTNLASASLRYVARVTDTTAFSPMFIDTLGWMLASYLAGPLIKGDTGAAAGKSCLQNASIALRQAQVSDANQRKIRPEKTPSWIANR